MVEEITDKIGLNPAQSSGSHQDSITSFATGAGSTPFVTLRILRWLTVVLPILFLALVDFLRHSPSLEFLQTGPASLVTLALLAGAIALFSRMVLDQVEAMQRRVIEQNKQLSTMGEAAQHQAAQLRALHEASLALASDLSLDAVLQRVVNQARNLAGAQYGALGVVDAENNMQQFITSGISAEDRARLESPPKGRGLLGAVLKANEPLRIRNIAAHPNSVGFPPGHPPMTSFLGVPISYKGHVLGNLYLTNKLDALEFSETDSAVLQLFAAQAAVAIENARLHTQVQHLAIEEERQRIAREMHDGLAQVLGYVNVKAGAARRLVDLGRVSEAGLELQQLENAAREVYAEVREAILGLRTITQGETGLIQVLRGYLQRFGELSNIPVELLIEGDDAALALRPDAEVQLIRIIQEALSNVRKHAGAQKAYVRLGVEQDVTVLIIEDDGKGFSSDRSSLRGGPQFGLQTMRERAEALGGSFMIDTAPGRGTRIVVRLPRDQKDM